MACTRLQNIQRHRAQGKKHSKYKNLWFGDIWIKKGLGPEVPLAILQGWPRQPQGWTPCPVRSLAPSALNHYRSSWSLSYGCLWQRPIAMAQGSPIGQLGEGPFSHFSLCCQGTRGGGAGKGECRHDLRALVEPRKPHPTSWCRKDARPPAFWRKFYHFLFTATIHLLLLLEKHVMHFCTLQQGKIKIFIQNLLGTTVLWVYHHCPATMESERQTGP